MAISHCLKNPSPDNYKVPDKFGEAPKVAMHAKLSANDPVKSNKNPGPGEYQIQFSAVEPTGGNMMSGVGRDSKYTADHIDGGGEDCTTDAHVGPGSYTPQLTKSGDSDNIEHKLVVNMNTGFGTDASVTSNSFRTMFTQWLGLTWNTA